MIWSIVAVVVMYLTVILGAYVPLRMPSVLGLSPIAVWTVILLIYAFVASVLPVTTLLQPRDYINSHELIVALALLVLGVLFAGFGGSLHIVAPAVRRCRRAAQAQTLVGLALADNNTQLPHPSDEARTLVALRACNQTAPGLVAFEAAHVVE